ncbi:MAG: protein translocase subunit SecD, partial [Pseudomonadota bacterium]|nr:protein translocase subunit SecD [Pseudomonadota bacterium]
MLNRYPLWKNLLILLIVVLGLLYSAPNLYPDDEAILINNENLEISEADIAVVETALEAAQIDFFGVVSDENSMQ